MQLWAADELCLWHSSETVATHEVLLLWLKRGSSSLANLKSELLTSVLHRIQPPVTGEETRICVSALHVWAAYLPFLWMALLEHSHLQQMAFHRVTLVLFAVRGAWPKLFLHVGHSPAGQHTPAIPNSPFADSAGLPTLPPMPLSPLAAPAADDVDDVSLGDSQGSGYGIDARPRSRSLLDQPPTRARSSTQASVESPLSPARRELLAKVHARTQSDPSAGRIPLGSTPPGDVDILTSASALPPGSSSPLPESPEARRSTHSLGASPLAAPPQGPGPTPPAPLPISQRQPVLAEAAWNTFSILYCLFPGPMLTFFRDLKGENAALRDHVGALLPNLALHPHLVLSAAAAHEQLKAWQPAEVLEQARLLTRVPRGPGDPFSVSASEMGDRVSQLPGFPTAGRLAV